MLFLLAIVLGLALGLVSGGKLDNLARVRFRWVWFVLVAVVVREAALLTPLGGVAGANYVYVVALAGIAVWTAMHWRLLGGIWLVTVGVLLNLTVIVANGARMPVAPEVAGRVLLARGTVGQYTLMGPGTNLSFLGDWIRLFPDPEGYSVGDVLVAVGLSIVVFLAVRNSPAYKELSPP